MKKRLLSLFMCLLMVCSAFVMASCSDDEGALEKLSSGEDDEFTTTSTNDPTTICIYSIRGEGTTDEAIELVEHELSRIAVSKYNTRIDLILIDEEDYASMIFTKVKMAVNAYNSSLIKDINSVTEDQLAEIRKSNIDYVDENGRSYGINEATNLSSEVLNGTLDIFLCYTPEGGNSSLYRKDAYIAPDKQYSMFEVLYREQGLAPLSTYLNNLYSDLKSVVYTHALEYVTRPKYKENTIKEIYGVPNNYVYGAYDYVIFNEKYVNEFISPNGNGTDKTDFLTSKTRYDALLEEIKAKYDNDSLTEAGSRIHTEMTFSSYEEYLDFALEDKDTTDAYTNDFAIARVSGSKAVGELFADDIKHGNLDVYTVSPNVHEVGSVDEFGTLIKEDALCESMFCIGLNAMGADQSGERVKRSLDILKLINTNKEFRNTLQYGVEGTHYTQYSEEEDVNPISSARNDSKYMNMNPKYFGNMFILYSSSTMTESEKLMAENNWRMAKNQILDVVPWLSDNN